jgi:hypothetical protein
MKTAAFLLAVISLVLVSGCQTKGHVTRTVAPAGTTDCLQAEPGTRIVQLTLRSFPGESPPRFEIGGVKPESVYLSIKALNKIRWLVSNEAGVPVNVTVDSFINELNTSERDPFGSSSDQNVFRISGVTAGNTGLSLTSAALNGKQAPFKYKITVDFVVSSTATTRVVLDPRVVVGD